MLLLFLVNGPSFPRDRGIPRTGLALTDQGYGVGSTRELIILKFCLKNVLE